MKLADFDYDLPSELIAQTPVEPRDSSRLLTFDRATDEMTHRHFRDLPELLQPGDVLVLNDTTVIPARLTTREGREVFLVREVEFAQPPSHREGLGEGDVAAQSPLPASPRGGEERAVWRCLVRGGKHFEVGAHFKIGEDLRGEVLEVLDSGERIIAFTSSDFDAVIERCGSTPLPPYIAPPEEQAAGVSERYQTVYADTRKKGSVAAPTAGLHFTPELFERLRERGVQIEYVTLHVGLGTFLPVKTENVMEHQMHAEFFTLTPEVAERLNKAKSEGRRIIAVGTTSCRVLESAADGCGRLLPQTGETSIFIYPGYHFKIISGLVTNFHLPKSTLVMLVSAFIGREQTLELYRLAVEQRYRFFSYGDAMLLL